MKENAKPVQTTGFTLLLSFLLFSFFAGAQAQPVSGTVSDETGKRLTGVSVTVKGTNTGTSTDASGQFQISAAPDAVLTFSNVGYTSTEVQVGGRRQIAVSL